MISTAGFLFLLAACAPSVSASPLVKNAKRSPSSPTYELGAAAGVSGQNVSYDYVIVGGGTAGLTIASILAQDPSITVAVIEAGGFSEVATGNTSVIPGNTFASSGSSTEDIDPKVDWGFVTEPQAGANNRRLHYATGKTLGGSSARNFMVYHRPSSGSLDAWATEVGDTSYNFENFLPFYSEGIQYTPPNRDIIKNITATPDSPLAFGHGTGPLQVSYENYNDPFSSWAQRALQDSGMVNHAGFNMGRLIGSGLMTFTIDPSNAHRSSSESSFLQQAMENTTLKVYTQTLAEKITFTGENVASGVVVSTNGGRQYILSARKEVIVSAGTFQSPQLLMVSGIGPRITLKEFDIPVVKDSPGVGQNLQDQPWWGSSFRVSVVTRSALQNDPKFLATAEEAWRQGQGPLATSAVDVWAWEKFPSSYRQNFSMATRQRLASLPQDWPELEWVPVSAFLGTQANRNTADPRDGYNYGTMANTLPAPMSRGSISINSSSMADAPLINPNWLTDPVDIELAIAATKRQRELWGVLSNYNLTIGEEAYPGPAVQTDAEIIQAIGDMVGPTWDAAATCKMGRANDPMAVIDASARVYGVERLRVVDASSFPFLPPGHPQSTVYALAQKIANDILKGL